MISVPWPRPERKELAHHNAADVFAFKLCKCKWTIRSNLAAFEASLEIKLVQQIGIACSQAENKSVHACTLIFFNNHLYGKMFPPKCSG